MSGFTSVQRAGAFAVAVDRREPGAEGDRDVAELLLQREGWSHLAWVGSARWSTDVRRWRVVDREGAVRLSGVGDLFTVLQHVIDDETHFG